MTTALKDLQQIKGIGSVLAQRLCEAGIDSYAAISKAGESRLKAIKGINPRAVPSIMEQAKQLQGETSMSKAERLAAVKANCVALRNSVHAIAESAHQRLAESLKGKPGAKLTTTLTRMIDAIDKVEELAHKKVKRTGKAVAKAERRIEKLAEAGHKELRKGLIKARKTLRRVLA